MKIFIIGLDGATSEHLFSDERLENFRRLMEFGCYGKLSYDVTLERSGLWMSLVTSQDVGPLVETESGDQKSYHRFTIWNQIEEQNKNVIVVGAPPFNSYPEEIETGLKNLFLDMRIAGENLTDNDTSLQTNKIYAVSRRQIEIVRNLMQGEEWDYFQFVDDGLYQLHESEFEKSENHSQEMFSDYCLFLDEQIGTILELIDDSTIVLVISFHNSKPFSGSFILASSNNPLEGDIEGAHLLDMAPTLLELSGYEVPTHMQGKSLVAGKMLEAGTDVDLSSEEEEILRERLSGLGYLS